MKTEHTQWQNYMSVRASANCVVQNLSGRLPMSTCLSLACGLAILWLAGCGGNDAPTSPKTSAKVAPAKPEVAPSQNPAPLKEPVSVPSPGKLEPAPSSVKQEAVPSQDDEVVEKSPDVTASSKPAGQVKTGATVFQDSAELDKYIKKIVEVSGFCNGIDGGPGKWQIYLSAKPSTARPSRGYLLKDQGAAWKEVVPGQTVTLLGYRRMEDDEPYHLVNCVLTKVEGPRCPELTAEELGKELEKLSEIDFGQKYGNLFDKAIIASGTVAELKEVGTGSGVTRARLQNSGKFKIWATMDSRWAAAHAKVGSPVRVYASVRRDSTDEANLGVRAILPAK